MDWTAFFAALGGLTVTIGTVFGTWYLRILSKRYDFELKKAELERKAKKDAAVEARKSSTESYEEVMQLVEAQKQQIAENRTETHDLRQRVQTAEQREIACQIKLSRAETKLEGLQSQLQDTNNYCEDLEDALKAKGIDVVRKRRPNPFGSGTHKPPTEPPTPPLGE